MTLMVHYRERKQVSDSFLGTRLVMLFFERIICAIFSFGNLVFISTHEYIPKLVIS